MDGFCHLRKGLRPWNGPHRSPPDFPVAVTLMPWSGNRNKPATRYAHIHCIKPPNQARPRQWFTLR